MVLNSHLLQLKCFSPLNSISQDFNPLPLHKTLYGEVTTPFSMIHTILDMFPKQVFSNPNLKWLDPAAGNGYFMIVLCHRLDLGLQHVFKNTSQRRKHILSNMIYMVEINPHHTLELRTTFGELALPHIYTETDFLTLGDGNIGSFHIIIGNPPYNSNGIIKVPTKSGVSKLKDGMSIWRDFVHKCYLLRPSFVSFIIPSIWMNGNDVNLGDKSIYRLLTIKHRLLSFKTFTNTQTNSIFHKQAQTPTIAFLGQCRCDHDNHNNHNNDHYGPKYCRVFDTIHQTLLDYPLLGPGYCIPVSHFSIIQKLQPFLKKYGSLFSIVHKTNMPRKNVQLYDSPTHNNQSLFPAIHTCTLTSYSSTQSNIVYKYSNIPTVFHNQNKIVLAHKMYGIPFWDVSGSFGISNRDNYVFLESDVGYELDFIGNSNTSASPIHTPLYLLFTFLSMRWIQIIYDSTRYRMKYLEKQAFHFIPNPFNMLRDGILPDTFLNEKHIYSLFGFDSKEIQYIEENTRVFNILG